MLFRAINNLAVVSDFVNGPHFEQPNVLAQVRYDVRPTVDGGRTLFLEEVQSDWHQKGKQVGYAQPTDSSKWSAEPLPSLEGNLFTVSDENGRTLGTRRAATAEDAIRQQQRMEDEAQNRNKTPNAPFKSDWHELVLKRMLREAAEKGYDSLSWTTGEQQAERYDLSKRLKTVEYYPDEQRLKAYDHEGTTVINKVGVPGQQLPDYVGKDAAQKLLSSHHEFGGERFNRIEGQDLKVSPQWTEALYDRAIPRFLDRYAKKWGAKVGETQLAGGKVGGLKMDGIIQDRATGRYQVKLSDGDLWGSFRSEDEAERAYNEEFMPQGVTVHSIQITPAMRKSILKEGQPISEDMPPIPWREAVAQELAG